MKKLKVNAGKGYDILIEKNLIKDCGKYISAVTRARKTAIITDSNVAPLYLEAVEKSLKELGEEIGQKIHIRHEKVFNSMHRI